MKKSQAKQRGIPNVGVVLEHIDSKLDLVVEGQEALGHQINTNQEEFREFRKEVDYKFNVVFDELHMIRMN